MRALDTNILVRLLVRDDAEQVGKAMAFIAKGGWVSSVALVETVWVLESVYEKSKGEIADSLALLLGDSRLTFHDADAASAALDQYRVHRALDFADCLILEFARKAAHLPLGTFDRALAKLPGAERLG